VKRRARGARVKLTVIVENADLVLEELQPPSMRSISA
jgi:hypothetical protein